MADHGPSGSRAPHGFEESDVSPGPVFTSVAVLLVFAGVVALAVALFLGVLTGPFGLSQHAGADRPREAEPSAAPGPDSPAWPVEDYHGVFAEQARRIEGAGWVDRGRGVVHMPIERAMELTRERLPARPNPAPSPRGAR